MRFTLSSTESEYPSLLQNGEHFLLQDTALMAWDLQAEQFNLCQT